MTLSPLRADVVVVGGGTAGAATAAFCAEQGLDVVLLERQPLDVAGARWVNDVEKGIWARAQLAPPEGEEVFGSGGAFHLLAGRGPERLIVEDHGLTEVDMRALTARLHNHARAAGVRLLGHVRADAVRDGVLETSEGPMRARWYVDASGLAGARLANQPRVAGRDICAAAQAVFRLRDRSAAQTFFSRHGAGLDDMLCFTGVAGGYSIVRVRCEGDRVSVLTGSIPALGFPSGSELLRDFVQETGEWLGERLYGGARAIPIRRARERLAVGNVALVGDAACQVFPQHGSGVGAGLVAARMLADDLAAGGGPEAYALRWQRRYGGVFATFELVRRLSERVTGEDLAKVMRVGLMDAEMIAAGLRQELPRPSLSMAGRKVLATVRAPRLGAMFGALGPRIAVLMALYRSYPQDASQVERWARRVRGVMGSAR